MLSLRRSIHRGLAIASVAGVAIGGCGGGGEVADSGVDVLSLPYCYDDPRAQPFVDGAAARSANGLFTLQAMTYAPAPIASANYVWTMRAKDASGNPIDGLTMNIVPWMPDHGHGAPVVPQATSMGGGMYSVTNVDLFMEGIWTITFTLQSGTMTDTAVFTFCVAQ